MNKKAGFIRARLHASSSSAVELAHGDALRQGGTDEGAPGPRPQYGDGYFGAYLRDPDGNKIHIVYRTDTAATHQD